MKQLSCDQCRERWDELINKSTFEEDPQIAEIRAHLESCADCRKMFDLLVTATQELQHFPSPKAPASLRANILREIEKSQQQHFSWWNSLLVSPQRLAWASGAIIAVFLVAFLMRPERQAQVVQITPKVLSNKSQVEEQNNAHSQRSLTPTKPQHQTSAKKVVPEKPRTIKAARQSPKPQDKKNVHPEPTKLPRHSPKPTMPAPKSTLDNNSASSGAPSIKPLNKPEPQENAAPKAQPLTAPTPMINDSAAKDQLTNNVARFDRSYSEHSANHSNSANQSRPMNPSMNHNTHGPEGQLAANSAFESQKSPSIIHWTKMITSDYDVTNAKITVTLEKGLSFADDAQNLSERTLWSGTLFRGKQISLSVDLRKTSTEPSKLHLQMIDTKTQKVLLDKSVDVN